MYELTIKQRLVDYYCFCIFIFIIVISLGVICFFPSEYGNHISYTNNSAMVNLYVATKYFCSVAVLVLLASLISLPTIFITNKFRLTLQTLIFSIYLSIFILDIRVFYLQIMHIGDFDLKLIYKCIINKGVLLEAKKLVFYSLVSFPILYLLLYLLNSWVINRLPQKKLLINTVAILVVLAFTITQVIFYTSNPIKKQELAIYNKNIPFSYNKADTINQLLKKTNNIQKNSQIIYPLNKLNVISVNKPVNIIIIAADAWRADSFNKDDTPNLWKFAQSGVVFKQHKSSGNHTQAGLFGLFYSLPPTYFSSFMQQQIPPVLLERIQQLDYNIGLFTHNCSPIPLFINNLSRKNLTSELKPQARTASQQDIITINNWIKWYEELDKNKPWFSFVFFYSVHENDYPDYYLYDNPNINRGLCYKKMVNLHGKDKFIKSHKISVHYMDSLAKKILDQLTKNNELENTIVIITADHGKEMNDNMQDNWGYGDNFTNPQIQVPFAIVGSKVNKYKLQNKASSLTTHYDLVATLMQNFLGVGNNIEDYSIGIDLFDKEEPRDWMLAASTSQHYRLFSAIVTEKQSCYWLPTGKYWLADKQNKQLIDNKVNINYLNQALEYMTRFIKK